MNRYVSIESYAGELMVLTEEENYAEIIQSEDTACWVWQFAKSKEQAKEQHYKKMDEYEANPDKKTY